MRGKDMEVIVSGKNRKERTNFTQNNQQQKMTLQDKSSD